MIELPRSAVTRGLIVIAGTAALLYLSNFRGLTPIWTFSQNEGGLWLDEAAQMLNGQLIYRDFFEFIGPGVMSVNAFVLLLIGRTAVGAVMIPLVVGVLLTWLLWRISAQLLSLRWQLLPPLLFACLIYPRYSPGNHKWIAWTCALFGIKLLMSTPLRSARLFAAGLCVGASALCTQDMGAALLIGTLAGLWVRTSWPARFAFVAGGLTIPIAGLGYLAARAGLGTMWQDLVLFSFSQYGQANGGFALIPYFAWSRVPEATAQWVIVCGSIAGGVTLLSPASRARLARTESSHRWLTVVLPGLAVVIITSWSRAIEPTQMAVRCVLLTIPFAWVLESASTRWRAMVRTFTTVLVVSAVSVALLVAGTRQTSASKRVPARAGAVWSTGSLADVEWVQSHTTPGEHIFLFPDKGGIFFLSRTQNATTYPFLQDMSFSPPDQVADAIRQLERARPRAGIFDRSRLFAGGPIEASSLWPLYQFITAHYRSEDGKYFLWRDSTAPGNR